MHFFPDTLSSAVMAYSRARVDMNHVLLYSPAKFSSWREARAAPSVSASPKVLAQRMFTLWHLSLTSVKAGSSLCLALVMCLWRALLFAEISIPRCDPGGAERGWIYLGWPKSCLCVPLAIPGDPDTLQCQLCGSHLSYPRKGLIP